VIHQFTRATGLQTTMNILRTTAKGLTLADERGRPMRFPRRQDYVRNLLEHGLIEDEAEFVSDDHLTEAVYLDWLRRPQVGCVFAQLLARPHRRTPVRTVVVRGASGTGDPDETAVQVARLVDECAHDHSVEALTVLMPQILDAETLTRFVWRLGSSPGWIIDRERSWRGTVFLIGLRAYIATNVVAETLGMGPFDIFPTTRQCPITTLEVRTKTTRARVSQVSSKYLAAHLADIPVDHMLTPAQHGVRFSRFTPWLRSRILGHSDDMRAKAGVTYSVPAAIWASLKAGGS